MTQVCVHTIHIGGSWYNEIDGEGRDQAAHASVESAVAAGSEMARARRAEHVIHNQDGTVAETNSYGEGPAPATG